MVAAKLLNVTTAQEMAVGAARTCYSSSGPIIISPEKYEQKLINEQIRSSTLEAGHNTTRQHLYFTFALENVSRQAIWSFLHSHPFYNSEQVSQRYVGVKKESFYTPESLTPQQQAIFHEGLELTFAAYQSLQTILEEPAREAYFAVFPSRRKKPDAFAGEIKKKAQEIARYALPVAAQAYLYHTISALTLMRMYQCADHFNVPTEQKALVQTMVSAVAARDLSFLKELTGVEKHTLEDSLEFKLHQEFQGNCNQSRGKLYRESRERLVRFRNEFDADLTNHASFNHVNSNPAGIERSSVLVGYDAKAQENLAKAVRSVLQVSRMDLPDDRAIELVLNPYYNQSLGDVNNVTTFTKLGTALSSVTYTFQKKISHSADSQNQRHRMTPETAPIFHVGEEPDVVLPGIVKELPAAQEYFMETMNQLWEVIKNLREAGVSEEAVQYLAPNATAVRLFEQGDLRNLHHKYRMRLCYNAQEEIWRSSVDEVQQISEVHPHIGRWLLPPCSVRKAAELSPACPEGKRFCGVPVWKLSADEYKRTI